MGFLEFFRDPDINQGAAECAAAPGAVLLDVRTPDEYRQGRLPGGRNLPLAALNRAPEVIESKDTPVFVYCYSGSRSRQAAGILAGMGYTNVKNIGGIAAWRGEVET